MSAKTLNTQRRHDGCLGAGVADTTGTGTVSGSAHDLSGMLAHHVRRRPGDPAVVDAEGSTELTFAGLWESSARVSGALRAAGVRPGDVVGVHLPIGRDLLVALWGILGAGAGYLTLPLDYPGARLRTIVEQAATDLVLTDEATREQACSLLPGDIAVDTVSRCEEHSPAPAHREVGRDAPAYVIFTSGSTGTPKGVEISRTALAHQLRWLGRAQGLEPGSRILAKTPIGFDAAQWELLATALGASVVTARPGTHRDPEALVQAVLRASVTHLQAVPTLWRSLVRVPALAECSSLRRIFSGGEALTVELADRLLEVLPRVTLVNLYGPTETTINITAHEYGGRDEALGATVPIGEVVPGCELHIVDDQLRPVGQGEAGELVIAGPQLATGYRGVPDLTAAAFPEIQTPTGRHRVYLTGDRVMLDEAGRVCFLGRRDHQVKVNGHRVETQEVTAHLERHDWVQRAEVIPWESEGRNQLVAFVELDPEEASLMDQDLAGSHHMSKSSRTQVRAQLAQAGRRVLEDAERTSLPDSRDEAEQTRIAFARKTYRTFRGDSVDGEQVRETMGRLRPAPMRTALPHLGIAELSDLLRWLGPFQSPDRLLPKYVYASPGALNATQVYVEAIGVEGLRDGFSYFDAVEHALVHLAGPGPGARRGVRLHLSGLPSVIETVYATNVHEVLHLEAGHMLGALEFGARRSGVALRPLDPALPAEVGVPGSVATASVELVAGEMARSVQPETHEVSAWVQVHGMVRGLRLGTYAFEDDRLDHASRHVIESRRVIAINQVAFSASQFAVTLCAPRRGGMAAFVELGRALQRLQHNEAGIGLMSSGYSSLSGRDLLTARRHDELDLHDGDCLTYFAVGGGTSTDQRESRGMDEDVVHMAGPAELLKQDLRTQLPHFMVPSRVELLARLPINASGKVDRVELQHQLAGQDDDPGVDVPAASVSERALCGIWSELLGRAVTSVERDFFVAGGTSLHAVRMAEMVRDRLGSALPVQQVFQTPTIRALAAALDSGERSDSRLVPLAAGEGAPIVLWPGLGGYPLNLRALARVCASGRPVWGVQALGLNAGETPHSRWEDLVADDLALVRELDLGGGVDLIGYSFGARVAASVAAELGPGTVRSLALLAPGSPEIPGLDSTADVVDYADPYFSSVLESVFTGGLPKHPVLAEGAAEYRAAISERVAHLDAALVSRLLKVVEACYAMRRVPVPPVERSIATLWITARDDGPSFAGQWPGLEPRASAAGHYELVLDEATARAVRRFVETERTMTPA